MEPFEEQHVAKLESNAALSKENAEGYVSVVFSWRPAHAEAGAQRPDTEGQCVKCIQIPLENKTVYCPLIVAKILRTFVRISTK